MTRKPKLALRADPMAVTKAPCCGRCSMWTPPDDPADDPFGECGRAVMTTTVLRPIWAGGRTVLEPMVDDVLSEAPRQISDCAGVMDFANHLKRRRPPKRRPQPDTRRIDKGEVFSRQERLAIDRGIPAEPMRTRSWAPACSLYVAKGTDRSQWAMFRDAVDDWEYWMGGIEWPTDKPCTLLRD